MKLKTATVVRPATALSCFTPQLRPLALQNSFATHQGPGSDTPSSRRRAVTPFNDDGHVPWTELSAGEKTARAAQQTFNFGLVIVGLALTVCTTPNPIAAGVLSTNAALVKGGVGYFLYSEVFSRESKVAYFDRAVDRIKKDPRCLEVLGDSKKITAHGEETANKWRRARPIA